MTELYLVRHGRAAAGWNVDPDPGLDSVGVNQAERIAATLAQLGALPILSSPLRRCQETAAALSATTSSVVTIENAVAEIPSPEGIDMAHRVEWLRLAMAGDWSAMGERYTDYRDTIGETLVGLSEDTVIFSHFVAINAAIGLATGDDRLLIRSLDNCSVTRLRVTDGRLLLVEGGREADTLIR